VNRPGLTAERFTDAVVGGVPGRWYRTGDAVREVAPGEFEYAGRLDRQVKLRGFRIELGEIEAALEAHDGVGSAVAELADEDDQDGPRLAAYLVLAGAGVGTAQDVREWLGGRLPEHMVPSTFWVIGELPVTGNGKLDRAALRQGAVPLPDRAGTVQPASPTEQILAAIWSEVLGKTNIGRDDYFFTIGGDSLLALRLVALISRKIGIRVGIATLYRHPTVAELARWVDESQESAAGTGP
jgi:aryl carrier-like protein